MNTYVHIYIYVYVCILSHPVENNPIHLPSILVSWAPNLRCFGCFGVKKTVGCTVGGSPGPADLGWVHLPKLTHKETQH